MAYNKPVIELSIDQHAFLKVKRAMASQVNKKELNRDLNRELKAAVKPGVLEVKGKLRGMHSRPSTRPHPALGSAMAKGTAASAVGTDKTAAQGHFVGVRVVTKSPKWFPEAAKYLDSGYWQHPLFGYKAPSRSKRRHGAPVNHILQKSQIPNYFFKTLGHRKEEYRDAVIDALKNMAERIARRGSTYR